LKHHSRESLGTVNYMFKYSKLKCINLYLSANRLEESNV